MQMMNSSAPIYEITKHRRGIVTIRELFQVLVYFVWCRSILVDFFWGILLRIPIINQAPDLLFTTLIICVIAVALPFIIRHIRLKDVVIYLFICALYSLTWMYSTQNSQTLSDYAISFMCLCLPLYFVGVCCDFSAIKVQLYYLSLISIIAMFLYKIVFKVNPTGSIDDMNAAYNVLPHVLMVLLVTLREPNWMRVIISMLGSIMLLSFGTRGPMVCIVVFFIIYLIAFKKWKHPLFIRSAIILIGIGIIYFSEPIILSLQFITSGLGMSSRVYTRLLDGSFLSSWGRDEIYSKIIPAIMQKPWTGYGFAGDRLILNDYSHSIILELWASFGIPVGSVIFVTILSIIIRGIIKSKDEEEKAFLLVLVCSSVLKLMLSSTYLNDRILYLLIGFCVFIIRRNEYLKPRIKINAK